MEEASRICGASIQILGEEFYKRGRNGVITHRVYSSENELVPMRSQVYETCSLLFDLWLTLAAAVCPKRSHINLGPKQASHQSSMAPTK